MCKYCNENSFNTIIENSLTEYATNIFGIIHVWDKPEENDLSVVFEMRNGSGYIRLGDRSEMACIDHSENFEVKHCPMCGRKLVQNE